MNQNSNAPLPEITVKAVVLGILLYFIVNHSLGSQRVLRVVRRHDGLSIDPRSGRVDGHSATFPQK
jgi:hypothetical protein